MSPAFIIIFICRSLIII
jgi:hypothetical protein